MDWFFGPRMRAVVKKADDLFGEGYVSDLLEDNEIIRELTQKEFDEGLLSINEDEMYKENPETITYKEALAEYLNSGETCGHFCTSEI
jgi:hypothetical protein